MVKPALTEAQLADPDFVEDDENLNDEDERVRFNIEHHMYFPDAQMMRSGVKLGDEIIFLWIIH